MTIDIPALRERYIDSCRTNGVVPNSAILSGLFKAEVKKFCHEMPSWEIFLHHFMDTDFLPLLDICLELGNSELEEVDVNSGSSCTITGEYALTLMRSIGLKLRVVDLQDLSFGKDFLRDLCQRGLPCQVLKLTSLHIRKLNMIGEFTRIHTLNLDFSISLTSFSEDCFNCMPKLRRLSMCETRISNLWTTVAALCKLPSLVELRFQNWLCRNDAEHGSASYTEKSDNKTHSRKLDTIPYSEDLSIDTWERLDHNSNTEEVLSNMFSLHELSIDREDQGVTEDLSDDSEMDFSTRQQDYIQLEPFSNVSPWCNARSNPQNEVSFDTIWNQNEAESTVNASIKHVQDVALKYISIHASPICFERHYREYMVASLPKLQVLDNIPVRKLDKERATITFSEHFEHLAYGKKHKESIVSILQKREIKAGHSSKQNSLYPSRTSQYYYTKSLCAAKVQSSSWPFLHRLSILGTDLGDERRKFRPRQFEYHPTDSSLLVFGTLDGEVVVVNHENETVVTHIPSLGAMNSVLGLSWLKKYPSKLIAGSDNGSLKLYDIQHMHRSTWGMYDSSSTFEEFEQLTSVHANSTDELFLVSGYSKNVALYDISSGRRIQVFSDMHREHINVVKFANHSPSIFATSSFDQDIKMWDLRQKPLQPCYTASSCRGNVMVCFSPDDHYLLASAVDNEVRQLLATDGRLHLDFGIAPTGSSQNYTRSYYMNGRDYIVSGSCDEHLVRICCAQTGRHLRDISLEGRGSGTSMFVQSLRGDPFREFNMSILAATQRPNSSSEIVKVNMLASSDHANEYDGEQSCPINSMGG